MGAPLHVVPNSSDQPTIESAAVWSPGFEKTANLISKTQIPGFERAAPVAPVAPTVPTAPVKV